MIQLTQARYDELLKAEADLARLRAPVADERSPSPCPFCGGAAFATYKTDDEGVRWHSVHCKTGCNGHGKHGTERDAIAAWNARAALASAPVAEPETMEEIHRQERERSPWKLPKDPTLPDCAPVTDESPMAKMADALREKARQEQQAYQDRRNQATEWGPMPEGTEADNPTSSAPVAGEYTSAMGEAAEAYLNSFPYAHKLPAQFRWADLWAAMSGAAPQASEGEK